MEELLHERLRKFAKSFSHSFATDNFFNETNDYCLLMYREEAEALADEIEHNYIPRPRDNKGIPFVEGETIYSIDPDTEHSAEIIKVYTDTLYIKWEDNEYDVVDACDMQHEKPEQDSLEKLRDDMQSKLSMWHRAVEESTVEAWADRLSAFIDKENK